MKDDGHPRITTVHYEPMAQLNEKKIPNREFQINFSDELFRLINVFITEHISVMSEETCVNVARSKTSICLLINGFK